MFIYLFCSNCSSFGHWEPFFTPLSLWHIPIIVGFCFVFSTFLLSDTIRYSRLILYISCSSPRIRSLLPFYWKTVGNQDWIPGGLFLLWDVVASVPSQLTRQGDICVYTNLCIYTFITTYVGTCVCVYIYVCVYICICIKLNINLYWCVWL